jgi:hypothetical protein
MLDPDHDPVLLEMHQAADCGLHLIPHKSSFASCLHPEQNSDL